jgi:D-inositol-3-phosphate glycosyltransferase
MMRIAMVSEHASPVAELGDVDAGGQNVHVGELSRALARAGHEVSVYTRATDTATPERVVTDQGFTIVHVPAGPRRELPKDELYPHMAEFAEWLTRDWAGRPPDIVHAHFWMSGLASVLATRALDIPMTHTYHALGTVKRRHQGQDDTSPPERIDVERMVGRHADRVIATCSDELFELIRLGVPGERICIVPSGVDPTVFRPDRESGRNRLRHRLLSVGRLVPRKGFDLAIRALPSLPDTELVIAGGPPRARLARDAEAIRLRSCAEQHGVADRVRLLGQVPRRRMPELLRSADLVLCTPWYEPFGIVPIEAMACGTPVVATAVGGLTDTVVDGGTGRHVPPGEPAALATAVGSLLADPGRRAAMSAAGRNRVCARYCWERVAAETARVYDRVLRERRADDGRQCS